MIREINKGEIAECVRVIRSSFKTVADEFGFTCENAPRFTAFATTEERLLYQLEIERRLMAAFFSDDGQMLGYYSLAFQDDAACELNNLCVLPEFRHRQVGDALLSDACIRAKRRGCTRMNISIVEENERLRRWYEGKGFVHTRTQKFDFFPFTCGYMEKAL